MEFIISRTDLLKNLQAVKNVIQSKNTNPVLDNFLFDFEPGKLHVYGSDSESTLQATIPLEVHEAGKFLIPADKLLNTLKNLPEQPLTFHIENNTVHITAENGKYTLPYENGEHFPLPPELQDPFVREMNASPLAEAIDKTIFATSNDEMRPALTGVLFHFKPDALNLVATDAHKLVKYSLLDYASEEPLEYILPKKPLQILKNLLAGQEFSVDASFTDRLAQFAFDNMVLTTVLINAKFPEYDKVIPVDNPNKLIVNREQFLNALRRTSIYASQTTYLVKLIFKGSQLQILARNEDMNSEAVENLTVNYEGEDMTIGFNAKSLMEMISHADSEELEITMSTPTRAVLFHPLDGMAENEEILMLLMPIAY